MDKKEAKNEINKNEIDKKEIDKKEVDKNEVNKAENKQESNNLMDKELERIKKLTVIIMGIFMFITLVIFSSEIIKILWSAITSDEVEEIRSNENYNISELLEEN